QGDLARTYENIGDALRADGNPDKAIAAYRSSLAVSEAIAGATAKAVAGRALSTLHMKIGDVFMQQGKSEDALTEYRLMLAAMQRFNQPDSVQWQFNTAWAYAKVGSALQALGKLDEALESYRQDLAILERLFAGNQNSDDLRSELADSHYRLAHALEAKGELQ